ncbi:hypothetical protein LWI28_000939 [Acer negundo]|uniref:Uncharacterized protein n=1 Tax=Acer negundo TaxID=4023 RepID=A0AAD5NI90_ACENE|nr:hypothetical protein LWI28_000939 [Acer negundo]
MEEFEDLEVSIVSLAKDPPPKIELKELPTTLKYVYLGANETYLLIVASGLKNEEEMTLIEELVTVEFAPTNGEPSACEPSPETALFWPVAAKFAPTEGGLVTVNRKFCCGFLSNKMPRSKIVDLGEASGSINPRVPARDRVSRGTALNLKFEKRLRDFQKKECHPERGIDVSELGGTQVLRVVQARG